MRFKPYEVRIQYTVCGTIDLAMEEAIKDTLKKFGYKEFSGENHLECYEGKYFGTRESIFNKEDKGE